MAAEAWDEEDQDPRNTGTAGEAAVTRGATVVAQRRSTPEERARTGVIGLPSLQQRRLSSAAHCYDAGERKNR